MVDLNSKDYWEHKFGTRWGGFGAAQTAFFGRTAIEYLPNWFVDDVREQGLSICDAGCGEGEGTFALAEVFPRSVVCGVDFAQTAVSNALKKHPACQFFCEDICALSREYDVIFSSNTLEHVTNPVALLQNLLDKARRYLVLLLPFQEKERIEEHLSIFDFSDFPLRLGRFQVAYHRIIQLDPENIFWNGSQILLIYAEENAVATKKLAIYSSPGLCDDPRHARDVSQYYALQPERDRLLQALKSPDKVEEISSFDAILRERESLFGLLQAEASEKGERINRLYTELFQKDAEVARLRALLVEKDRLLEPILPTLRRYERIRGAVRKLWSLRRPSKLKSVIKHRVLIPLGLKPPTDFPRLFDHAVAMLSQQNLKGIAVLASAMEFDILYNQRTINLAKFLDAQGYFVFFVVWQWFPGEHQTKAYRKFGRNIHQVPMYHFFEHVDLFRRVEAEKLCVLTIPSEHYVKLLPALREASFTVTYDVLDDWEEFFHVGQAPWYSRECEEGTILASDQVAVVSTVLQAKFSHLREDIHCIGNGYDASLLGPSHRGISVRKARGDGEIHLGYFGHLTESWFDWELLLDLADVPKVQIHLIGYGLSEAMQAEIEQRPNIHFHGKVSPADLHHFVRQWHVGLIPFRRGKLSQAVDPIKIYEYLYFGLPTLVSGIESIRDYPSVRYCEDAPEAIQALQEVYQTVIDGQHQESTSFLEATTWEQRFHTMLHAIKASRPFGRLYHE